jgi:hypothetical protein
MVKLTVVVTYEQLRDEAIKTLKRMKEKYEGSDSTQVVDEFVMVYLKTMEEKMKPTDE